MCFDFIPFIFKKNIYLFINRFSPIAVLHLYFARFISHFLHLIGWLPEREPFKRLLVQGMVMGRSYRVKGSGRYLKPEEIDFSGSILFFLSKRNFVSFIYISLCSLKEKSPLKSRPTIHWSWVGRKWANQNLTELNLNLFGTSMGLIPPVFSS